MCLFGCLLIWVCVFFLFFFVFFCLYVFLSLFVCFHRHSWVFVFVCVPVCLCACLFVCLFVCVPVCLCACLFLCLFVCVHSSSDGGCVITDTFMFPSLLVRSLDNSFLIRSLCPVVYKTHLSLTFQFLFFYFLNNSIFI